MLVGVYPNKLELPDYAQKDDQRSVHHANRFRTLFSR